MDRKAVDDSEDDQTKINRVNNIAQDIHSFVQQMKNSNISSREEEEPEEENHI